MSYEVIAVVVAFIVTIFFCVINTKKLREKITSFVFHETCHFRRNPLHIWKLLRFKVVRNQIYVMWSVKYIFFMLIVQTYFTYAPVKHCAVHEQKIFRNIFKFVPNFFISKTFMYLEIIEDHA